MSDHLAEAHTAAAQLQREYAAAWDARPFTLPGFLGGATNSDDAVYGPTGALAADLEMIRRLDSGDLFKRLQSGDLAWNDWLGYAKTTHDDMAYLSADIGSWSFKGELSATANQTVSDVESKALDIAGDHWMLIGGAVAVLLLIVWLRVA